MVATLVLLFGFAVVRLFPNIAQLSAYGYVGVFFLMIVSGGSILFPMPGLAAVLAAGVAWNPLLVGVVAGLGNSIGEFTGYLAGRSGRAILGKTKDSAPYVRAERLLTRHGIWALIVFAAIPNPLFDIVGLVAGSLGYSPKRFWIACAIGNTIKYTGIALLGSTAFSLI